jgi:two-component system, OmpR family, alkaline phosphatase synthesis response regulator PhoP
VDKLIYIVEDDENIRELVAATLGSAGFIVEVFEDSKTFYTALTVKWPSLIILDIMLPVETGLDILKKISRDDDFKNTGVIFLTAKSTELDKVKGLDLGADDFIVKPFGILELISRVKAVRRRYVSPHIQDLEKIIFKDLLIDKSEKCIYKNEIKLPITFKEYELFQYLYKNRGIVMSREKLLEKLWNYDFEGETRTVDVHVRSLRNKIGDNTIEPMYISTIRGHGYMLLKE